MLVVNIGSTLQFGKLKNSVYSQLQKAKMFLNLHNLPVATLDCAFTGWLFKEHPRFHSPGFLQAEMKLDMEAWWSQLTTDEKNKWGLDEDEMGNG